MALAEKGNSMARVNVLGVHVAALDLSDLLERAVIFAAEGKRHQVMYVNVSVLNIAYRDPELQRILNAADLVYCDGMGVVWGARLLGYRLPRRMTGADWIYQACARWRDSSRSLFILGGRPGIAEAAAAKLRQGVPGLQIAGTHQGFFVDPLQVVDTINAAGPDVIIVAERQPLARGAANSQVARCAHSTGCVNANQAHPRV